MIIKYIVKEPKLSANGKLYGSVKVLFDEYKDGTGKMRWVSGFLDNETKKWKVGDDVNPNIQSSGDGKYLNLVGNEADKNTSLVYSLNATVGFVMELLKSNGTNAPQRPQNTPQRATTPQNHPATAPSEEYPDDADPADIPF